MSSQCSSEILSCIGKGGGEPRNIFKLALPVYHGLDGSLGVFGLPEWGGSSSTKNLPLGKLLVLEELAPTLVSQTHQVTHLGHDKLEKLI